MKDKKVNGYIDRRGYPNFIVDSTFKTDCDEFTIKNNGTATVQIAPLNSVGYDILPPNFGKTYSNNLGLKERSEFTITFVGPGTQLVYVERGFYEFNEEC